MDEVNEAIAGRPVLEMNWSADGDRLHVVVFDGLDAGGKVKETDLLFERAGDRFCRALAKWRPSATERK